MSAARPAPRFGWLLAVAGFARQFSRDLRDPEPDGDDKRQPKHNHEDFPLHLRNPPPEKSRLVLLPWIISKEWVRVNHHPTKGRGRAQVGCVARGRKRGQMIEMLTDTRFQSVGSGGRLRVTGIPRGRLAAFFHHRGATDAATTPP